MNTPPTRRLSLDSVLRAAAVVLGVAAVGLMLTPASVWRAPVNDAVYHGFDSNLMYSSDGGTGRVDVSKSEVDIAAPPGARPSINLATTLLPNMTASVDVTVLDNNGADEPFRIGVWSPWTSSGYFLVFGAGPDNPISAELLRNGSPGATLADAVTAFSNVVGHYQLNVPYTLSFDIDRTGGSISAYIAAADADTIGTRITSGERDLFQNVQLSLTASAGAGQGTSHVVLQNFSLTLPHQRWWAVKVDDPTERFLVVLLTALSLALLLVVAARRRSWSWLDKLRAAPARAATAFRRPGRALLLIAGAVLVYLAGNTLLFPLGSHPFDFGVEELYSYVAWTQGLSHLYYLPNYVSLAGIWAGIPYSEAAFPYGPTYAYLYGALGWIAGHLFGTFALGDVRLLYLLKSVNVLFGLADAALIYAIVRGLALGRRWSLAASGFFMFNPAVWFSMSIWGQTHVISIFFVLAAVWLAEKRMPLWAWLALTAALLTRPQMIVFALLLGIVFLRKFPWRENLEALSWTVIVTFIALLPLTLATSPSLPVDVMLNNFHIQEAGGNGSALSPVSQGGYSIWPLVTYLAQGASGLSRTFTPSADVLVGGVTYQRLAQVLTLAAILFLGGWLLLRKRAVIDSGGYIPVVTLGIASFLMLVTGVVATHFLLALPFLLLCRRWMNTVAYLYVIAIWTVTTFVPMYGEMGALLSSQDYPLLAPASNSITAFVVRLFAWDRFITLAVVANVCAVVWLGWLTLRRSVAGSAPLPPRSAPESAPAS